MAEEKKGCVNCGDPNIINPRTGLCATCEPIFQERNKADFRKRNPIEQFFDKKRILEKKKISPDNPIGGILNVGDDLLEVLEHFGIEKKEVGKALLKSAVTGKFDLFGGATTGKKLKFEKYVAAIKELMWIPLIYIVTYFLLTLLIQKLA